MQRILILFFTLLTTTLFSQEYFQQYVDYKINVHLNDQNHTLEATEIITYTNNSPNTLKEIYFHLWANAYKVKNSAFGKQKLRNNNKKFYFAKDEERGGYLELSFSTNDSENEWSFDKKNQDIAIVNLDSPLKPGESVEMIIHFTIKIPIAFSRFNRIKESYNITQWYPKPAVYDKDGWNPMPYLDFGEFYSEFGNYDVTITLPKNYVVAATGTLTTETEINFLDELVQKTDQLFDGDTTIYITKFDPDQTKTINFTAKNVHDFAWFANKNFLAQKKDFQLKNGDSKTAWAFFPKRKMDHWKDATDFLMTAVQTMSNWVGMYPYPHATAIMSETSIGSDMEYPMITSIGPSSKGKRLKLVIRHEVGHNWFYGILGSNERYYAWMDEGLNSFYDNQYEKTERPTKKKKRFQIKGDSDENELMIQMDRNKKNEVNPSQNVENMGTLQYANAAYGKPSIAFKYLEQYLGEAVFESIMKTYYSKWKFKHPSPKDLQEIFETKTKKDLAWLFEGFLSSTDQLDYTILSVKDEDEELNIKIGNLGKINGPVHVNIFKDDQIIYEKWLEGFSDVETLTIPVLDYDKIVIDSDHISLDANKKNNTYFFKKGTFEPIKFKPFLSLSHSQENRINFIPVYTWNNYDKSMIGLSLYNLPVPTNRLDYWLTPMYSFKSKTLTGFGRIRFNTFPGKGIISRISLGLEARRFTQHTVINRNSDLYQKINPYIQIEFRKKATSYIQHAIHTNLFYVKTGSYGHNEHQFDNNRIVVVNYLVDMDHPIFPFSCKAEFENNNWFGSNNNKISFEYKQGWYYSKSSDVNVRFFVGNSFANSESFSLHRYRAFSLYGNSFSDYKYEGLSAFRQDVTRSGYTQLTDTDGGFRSNLGTNKELRTFSKTIFSSNVTISLPSKINFIKPYFDFAMLADDVVGAKQYWSTGISLGLKKLFYVNFPIASSFETNDISYIEKISFSINLQKIDPWKINYRKLILKIID